MIQKPSRGLFVVGTDTDVGKTFVATLLAKQLTARCSVGVYKPVASGCRLINGELLSDDAELLWSAVGRSNSLRDVAPQRFAAALAPNVAAKQESRFVCPELLRTGIEAWQDRDFMLVEGVGGLMSPISDEDLVIDLALDFEYPLLIVVPNVLGCINSTLLTVSAARAAGLSVFGIVLNDTMHPLDSSATSNRSEISRLTDVPVVAHVDFGANELAVEKFSELFN